MTKVITENLIDLNIEAEDKLGAIRVLSNRIEAAGRLYDGDGYLKSVIEREFIKILEKRFKMQRRKKKL